VTLLTDKLLKEAGLRSVPELLGFRTAMSHAAARSPTSLPMPESYSEYPSNESAFLRGARIAGRWRSTRARHRETRTASTEFGLLQENRRIKATAFDQVVEAIAAEDGFPDASSALARDMGIHVSYGERQYVLSRCVSFFEAKGPNGILSPVHPTRIECAGLVWNSVEAIYQAHKHLDPEIRRLIREAPDALAAKAVSRGFETSIPSMKDRFGLHRRVAMARAQILRAGQDEAFAQALLATGDLSIVESCPREERNGSDWGTHGSVVAMGWNTQGRLLERVRTALANGVIVTRPATSDQKT
jgi:predicted NAD-dependent protein-ADP-ribosyltransferase YbiA (DUF1768 family)